MNSERKSQWNLPAEVAGAALWATCNILLMKYVGEWLVYSGGVCVALAIAVWGSALLGKSRARSILANGLLVLTLVNFNAWAFSHLANLVFYLGLFFFMLFAVITGSTLFRLLSSFEKVSKRIVNSAGVFCVLLAWGGALVLEASYLPQDAYKKCLQSPRLRRLPDGMTSRDLDEIPRQARQYLIDNHGSNLTLAYLRWELQGGELEINLEGISQPLPYQRSQRRIGFGLRLVVSLVLVAYGVFSQLSALKKTAGLASTEEHSEDEPASTENLPQEM
ncbi:MAG: hypothetical protein IID41_17025 [Planctomycetes bacterium]|nr:hypothetical protein [Planctomycetota bacterium]